MIEQSETFHIPEQQVLPEPHGAVLQKGDFLIDFGKEASRVKPGEEVAAMAMVFQSDDVGRAVGDVFKNIPTNVSPLVSKQLYFDDFSRLTGNGTRILEIDKYIPWQRDRATQAQTSIDGLITELESNGVTVNILNPTTDIKGKLIPFTGRNHMKGSYVENGGQSVFYIQTGNFEDEPMDDIFIKITGQEAIRFIELFRLINGENPPETDSEFELSKDFTVVYDSGKKGE